MNQLSRDPEYHLKSDQPPPEGYPQSPKRDTYTLEPTEEDYSTRMQALLSFYADHPAPENTKALYYELTRVALDKPVHKGVILAGLEFIDQRQDCADFVMHAVLRLLYQFPRYLDAEPELARQVEETILNFKYWPDEPGIDSMCTWTENHQILFASAAFLAGQYYPQKRFTNSGLTGSGLMARHRSRILRWMELRFWTGFSEWLSNVYYDEDFTALLSLVDFAVEHEISNRAKIILDLLLLDMALNSYRGVFGCTHGRSYEASKKWAHHESTIDLQKLVFGMGVLPGEDNMSAICLALSAHYAPPSVLVRIAQEYEKQGMLNRQQMGIRIRETERWGISRSELEDGMVLLSLEAYTDPATINLTMRMFDEYHWWQNNFFAPFQQRRTLINSARRLGVLPLLARLFIRDLTRNTREAVNIYTYRTADTMLSTAQDYRPGYGGDQQHIWQATLGPDAVCFTTHPARRGGASPNYWTGSGTLPRAAQVENVTLVVYKLDALGPALYVPESLELTHAWLPQDKFDEVREEAGWIFASKGDGYLALRSQNPYQWQQEPGEDQEREVLVPGKENIWICELGRKSVYGTFHEFVQQISAAQLVFNPLQVTYISPSAGQLEFGWDGPLLRNGMEISLSGYPRYDNPYVKSDYPSQYLDIRARGEWLRVDWTSATRQYSNVLDTLDDHA